MQSREVRLAAVLYAQVLGFDRLFDEDAETGLALLDRLNEIFGRVCSEHRGRVVRSVRDTYLVEFPTALDAVHCSIAIQKAVAGERSPSRSAGHGLSMGVHIGDVHFLDNDAAGEAIVVATRLQAMARPGTISISEEVFNIVSGKVTSDIHYSGEAAIEGGTKKVRAYEVVPSGTEVTPEVSSSASSARQGTETRTSEEFEELKGFVLEQIKRAGRRISTDKLKHMLHSRSPELDEAIEKLADMGFLSRSDNVEGDSGRNAIPGTAGFSPSHLHSEREAWREARHAIRDAARRREFHGHHHPPHPHHLDDIDTEIGAVGYAEYRERIIERAHKAAGGFAGHLIPFLVVNGFLFYINLTTGFGFPWFLFPLGGWAIGLISHFVTVGSHRRERAEVEALPATLEELDYRLLRKYHKARRSTRATLASTLSVAGFLLMVNLITSPGFLWAAFPIAGLFIAIVSTLSSYLSRRASFRKRLKELFRARRTKGEQPPQPLTSTPGADDPAVVRQAFQIAGTILDQAKKLDPTKAYLGEDLDPLLTNYIEQIRTLAQRGKEVDGIMSAIPRAELQRDLAALRQRHEKAADASLKREYQRSIEQIERQNRSFDELENQKELLELRISGSLHSLKQMQIDLARMTSLSSVSDVDSIGRLREKSQELSEYLQDFNDGYNEIEGLRQSGEQERERADQLLKDFKEKENKARNDR